MDPKLQALANSFLLTTNADNTKRREAEAAIRKQEAEGRFSLNLLQLVRSLGSSPQESIVRQLAATYFKNFISQHWNNEDTVHDPIPDEVRSELRLHVIDVMVAAEEKPRLQLSMAIAAMGLVDYPTKWPGMLSALMGKLNTQDPSVIRIILRTINECFKDIRSAEDTDDLRRVVRAALDTVGKPLLQYATALDGMAATHAAAAPALSHVLGSLRFVFRIFRSLSAIDLPDVFEDDLQQWMQLHLKYLTFESPLLQADADDDSPGPVDEVRAAVISNVALYGEKYDEDFQPFFGTFSEGIWKVLMAVSDKPREDEVFTSAMTFITRVMGKRMHAGVFQQQSTIQGIVERICVPNLPAREVDEDRFEEDADEYVTRDLQGADEDTRRRAAYDMLREAVANFDPVVSDLCLKARDQLLATYAADREGQWKAKDAVLLLVSAVAAKTETRLRGVMEVNPRIDVPAFIVEHVAPEIADPDVNARPIVKAAALRFVIKFRNQVTADLGGRLFPYIPTLLSSSSAVVRTYAAVAVDRLLLVRDSATPSGVAGPRRKGTPRFGRKVLEPHVGTLLPKLFQCINTTDTSNSYLMSCVVRVVVTCKEGVAPFVGDIVTTLTKILERVCAHPAYPRFNHKLFEAVAALIKVTCRADPSRVAAFEGALLGPFQTVLQQNVTEITPFVLQVLAQLLELNPEGVSAPYQALLPPLLTPAAWENRGNVPALVRLLQAYMARGGRTCFDQERVLIVLNKFAALIARSALQRHAFDLALSAVRFLPPDLWAQHLGTLLQTVLTQLQKKLLPRNAKLFIKLLSVTAGLHGGRAVLDALEAIQPGLAGMVFGQIVGKHLSGVLSPVERKACLVGLSRVLADAGPLLQTPFSACVAPLLTALVGFCQGEVGKMSADLLATPDDDADVTYSSGFMQLAHARAPVHDDFGTVKAPQAELAKAVKAVGAAAPNVLQAAGAAMPADKQAILQKLMA